MVGAVELSLYVAVFLALIELARALHVWWRTRLVRPLYEAHYVDHRPGVSLDDDVGATTYTRYDRTTYFGRSPYARVLPAIVSREGVVVLVVALIFADAFLSLCALAPRMRVQYGFFVTVREWFDERTEGYEVYQRYIRLGVRFFVRHAAACFFVLHCLNVSFGSVCSAFRYVEELSLKWAMFVNCQE